MFILRRPSTVRVPGEPTLRRVFSLVVVAAAMLALVATTRPYVGMVHDARLYFVQVANRLHPGSFVGDLFVAYGSQDRFSVFSVLHAPLFSWLGAAPAAMVYVCVSLLLWIAVIAALSAVVTESDRVARVATVAMAAAVSHYGAYPIFGFAEPFATPRLLAEVLGLAAVVLFERKRPAFGSVLLVAAMAVHPLMTIPIICWMGVRHLPERWMVTGIGVGIVLTVSAGMVGVEPFVRLFQQFDAEWFAVVQRRLQFALPDLWDPVSWLSSALPMAALSYAAAVCRDVRGAIARSLLTAALILLATATIGSLGRNVLLVNLQLWRVLWIVGVVGVGVYATLCVDLWHRSQVRYAVVLALLLAIVERLLKLPPLASGAVGSVALAAAWMEGRYDSLPRTVDLLVAAFACLGLCVTLLMAWAAAHTNGAAAWLPVVISDILVVAIAACVLLYTPSPRHWASLGVACVLLVTAVVRWDRRNPLYRHVETAGAAPADVRAILADRTVYWEDGVELLWLQFRMPSYYSCLQGSGAMFYQATAQEYRRRGEILARLGGGGFEPASGGSCEQTDQPTSGAAAAVDGPSNVLPGVCRELGDVDLLILPRRYPGVTPTATLNVPMMRHRVNGKVQYAPGRVYAYTCAGWRA